MTDDALNGALRNAVVLEKSARARWHAAPSVEEGQAALLVVRHATALIRSLEGWIAARAAVAQT